MALIDRYFPANESFDSVLDCDERFQQICPILGYEANLLGEYSLDINSQVFLEDGELKCWRVDDDGIIRPLEAFGFLRVEFNSGIANILEGKLKLIAEGLIDDYYFDENGGTSFTCSFPIKEPRIYRHLNGNNFDGLNYSRLVDFSHDQGRVPRQTFNVPNGRIYESLAFRKRQN